MSLTAAPVLETARLRLRGPEAHDLPAHVAFMATERSRWVGGTQTEREAWRGFASGVGHWHLMGFGLWTVTRKGCGRAIGRVGCIFAGGWPEREIGWSLYEGEGEGLAFEAAEAALAHAFGPLGWTTAVSYVHPENARSIRLAERLGGRLDPDAAPIAGTACLVFRHPAPEAAR